MLSQDNAERIRHLPSWAQRLINRMDAEADSLRSQLDVYEGKIPTTQTWLERPTTRVPFYIPERARVHFAVPVEGRPQLDDTIVVSRLRDRVSVRTTQMSCLHIVPSASNSAELVASR